MRSKSSSGLAKAILRRSPQGVLEHRIRLRLEPDVAELEDVYLYTVDDLQGVVDENIKAREEAAAHARRLIDVEVMRFTQTLKTRDAAPTSTVEIELPGGERIVRELQVAQREYRIQRIDGLPPSRVEPPPEVAERIRRGW